MGMLSSLLDKLFPSRGRSPEALAVRAFIRRGTLSDPPEREAYFVTVVNASDPITISQVWIETPTQITIYTKPLPVTLEPGEEWETWLEARELPPGVVDFEPVAGVALADGTVVASEPGEVPSASEPS